MAGLSTHNKPPRQTVTYLVTVGLGYCCPYFFFTHYRNTALIAARLGVTERAVRYAKAAVDDGVTECAGCESCMNKLVTKAGKPRKQPEV